MFQRIYTAVANSFRPSVRTIFWLAKIMLPITIIITCLDFVGAIGYFSIFIAPVFSLIGLPGESALVFLTSIFATPYSAIAIIATLGFDYRSVTILAVMSMICHNLIIETAIQRKTGASAPFIAALRIGAALLMAWLLNLILPVHFTGRLFLPAVAEGAATWGEVAVNWAATMGPLMLRMFIIIVALNIIQHLLREFKIMPIIAVPLRPFMAVFGLPRTTSFLWIICNFIGLTYGSAALTDEIERGDVTPADSRLLNTHVAISHSMLEDTIVMASIGIGVFWLIVPRLVFSVIAVWLHKGYFMWQTSRSRSIALENN